MKATIENPMAVKAAGTLANGNYRSSVFQLRRVSDALLIAGTNAYVSFCSIVPATFSRWRDGKSVTFGKAEVLAMMRAIGKSLKNASDVTFEVAPDDKVTVSATTDGAIAQAFFAMPSSGYACGKSWENVDWEKLRAYDSEAVDGKHVNPRYMKQASQAMDTLGVSEYCAVEVCGERDDKHPIRLIAEADGIRAVALVCLATSGA